MGPCIAMGAAAAHALDLAGTRQRASDRPAALRKRFTTISNAATRNPRRSYRLRAPARRGEAADRDDARMKLTDDEQAMLDGSPGRRQARAMDLLVRYGEALGAERFVDTNNVAGGFNASTPSVRALVAKGFDAVFSEFDLDSDEIVDVPKWRSTLASSSLASTTRSGASRASLTSSPSIRRKTRAILGAPRHPDAQDLHSLFGGQCAGERRALRLDGILGCGVLQLRPGRAHQYRRPREHGRRDADRQDSGLGLSLTRVPPRHPPHRSRGRRSKA